MNQRYIFKSLQIFLLAVCLFPIVRVHAAPPAQVLTVVPGPQAQRIARSSNIVVTFDSPVTAAAVNTTNFVVTGAQSGRVAGIFTGGGTSTITFNPTRDFHAGEVVTVTLTDALGVSASGYTWQFTVVSATVAPVFTNIPPLATDATMAYEVYPVDLDRDGDLDMVSTAIGNVVSWYENTGTTTLVNHRITPLGAVTPTSIRTEDLDNDGDIDIVLSSYGDSKIIWLENNGAQVFTPRTLATGEQATVLHTADMDGDGLVDVLAASEAFNKITLYKNDGASNFTVVAVATGVRGANGLHVADVDSDGDLDILSSSFDNGTLSDGKIAWYENRQASGFVAATISTDVQYASSVYAADMDGDGDMDVVSNSDSSGELFWHENDGSQTFTIHTIVDLVTESGGQGVHVTDIDGDGDMDVLGYNLNTKNVLWYENNGAQAFTSRTVSTGSVDAMMTIYAADIDNDGDMDVMTASLNDNKVAWFQNSATPATNHAPTFTKGGNLEVGEDAPLQSVAAWATNISAGDPGEFAQVLSFEVSNDNNALFSVQPTLDATGALTFQPAANAWGTATVTVVLHDNGGTASGGADQSAPASFTITVYPVNDAPLIDAVADVTLPAGSAPVVITLTGLHPGPNEDSQQLTAAASSDNPFLLANPTVTLHADGTATLTLVPTDASGTVTITVVLRDDGGTARGGDDETVITFTVILTDTGVFQTVFIPTLFSPNNDGSNDVFRVRATDVAEIRFSVYTADGYEVFRTTDINEATDRGWDGRSKGREMPAGTYTWTLQGRFTNGDPLTSGKHGYGQVMLLR